LAELSEQYMVSVGSPISKAQFQELAVDVLFVVAQDELRSRDMVNNTGVTRCVQVVASTHISDLRGSRCITANTTILRECATYTTPDIVLLLAIEAEISTDGILAGILAQQHSPHGVEWRRRDSGAVCKRHRE